LLLGLSVSDKKTEPDEGKVNAMIGHSNQQFLARVGAIELDDEGKVQSRTQRNDLYTILPWVDGVAWLFLIIGLEDVSAIAKAVNDASNHYHTEEHHVVLQQRQPVKIFEVQARLKELKYNLFIVAGLHICLFLC
jgi:hypothetical protein